MNDCKPSFEGANAPSDALLTDLPNAEALYQQFCALLQPLRTPQTQLVGITSGGAWIAQRLQQQWGLEQVGVISTAMHRDDFAQRGLSHTEQTSLPFVVDGAHILLIDDVLHTGRTIRAALNEIYDFARPASVQLAVLVDRGGRELPFHATVAAAQLTLPRNQSLSLQQQDDGTFTFQLRTRTADNSPTPAND